MTQNRLAHQTSPYLRQHANNPVHWHPWDRQALSLARDSGRPILLSIGYSACHWCHVMAHECFEDPAIAQVMNDHFINIKVDREERPDLDKIYQTAHQLLTGRPGGWPLTIFLDPQEQTPFFAGTYFPPQPRHGLPAFGDLLHQISDFFQQHPEDLAKQNHSLLQALNQTPGRAAHDEPLSPAPLDLARQQLARDFDPQYGGFGRAPKFPHPTLLERLLRHWAITQSNGQADKPALEMVHTSLHAMGSGGFYDQLDGGFFRYSVDERWEIPHFEKMLYDNGPLLLLYAQAWLACGEPAYRRIALESARWVIDQMQSPEGGYYTTLDADSEGKEGAYYLWDNAHLRKILDQQEYQVVRLHYGLEGAVNFEGHWHLNVRSELARVAEQLNIAEEQAWHLLQQGREKLLAQRSKRSQPHRDEKILTAWNGLMIKAMLEAGRILQQPSMLASARQAIGVVREHLWNSKEQRLYAVYTEGQTAYPAYLDDYAFLLDALITSLQTDWRAQDLRWAQELADQLLARFEDREHGGFYFTEHDHEHLIHRPKSFHDDSTPAGNAVAAQALIRLGNLLSEARYLRAAERTLECAWYQLSSTPTAHNALLTALELWLYPADHYILRCPAEEKAQWQNLTAGAWRPRCEIYILTNDDVTIPSSPGINGAATLYRCRGFQCQAPLTTRELIESELTSCGVVGTTNLGQQ